MIKLLIYRPWVILINTVMSKMQAIEGWWKAEAFDGTEGKSLSVIAGLLGEIVFFSDDGIFDVHLVTEGGYRYHCIDLGVVSGLDIWIEGLEPLTTKAIYEIEGSKMRICVAGRPIGADGDLERPDAIRRHDPENWVVQSYSRTEAPRSNIFSRLFRGGWKLRKGRMIPDSFLEK